MNILIIDDDTNVLKTIKWGLEPFGHAVVTGQSLADARRLLEGFIFDAIILDLLLENGRGAALVAEVVACSHGAPVVMLTGHGKEVASACVMPGATTYLCKGDVTAADIDRAVRNAVEVNHAFRPVECLIKEKEHLLRANVEDSKNITPPK